MRALASPLPIAWVTADSAYGQEWRFRRMLEEAGVGYVLAVPKSQHVHALGCVSTSPSPRPPTTPGNVIPAATAQRGHASTTGPQQSCPPSMTSTVISPPTTGGCWPAAAWPARTRSPTTSPTRPPVPRHRTGADRRDPLGDRGVLPGREERVRPGPVRSPPLPGLVPAHHPGHARPRFPGRHGRRAHGKPQKRSDQPRSLTVAEIRRLLDTPLPHPRPAAQPASHALTWSRWRRRHQAIARRCHYRKRASSGHEF